MHAVCHTNLGKRLAPERLSISYIAHIHIHMLNYLYVYAFMTHTCMCLSTWNFFLELLFLGKNLTTLTASYKRNLLKPEMDEDLKCPNARMTWECGRCLQSMLDFFLSGEEAVPSLQKRLKEDCTATRPWRGGDRAVSGFRC